MDAKHVHQENAILGEKAELVSFNSPLETRRFPLGRLDLVKVAGATIGRGIFEPGWRWSASVKPIAKTESCEAPHFQYHLAGTLRIIMDDGTIIDAKAGDVTMLPSGHDAYVIGDEAVVVIDFQGMADYAASK